MGLISRGGEQNLTLSSNLSFLLPVYLNIIHLTWNHQQTILSLQDEKSELAVKCQSQLLSSSQGTQKASAGCSVMQENQLVGIYLIQRPRTCFSKKHFDNLPTAFASQPADKTHHISGCLHPTPNAETFQKVLKRVYRQQISVPENCISVGLDTLHYIYSVSVCLTHGCLSKNLNTSYGIYNKPQLTTSPMLFGIPHHHVSSMLFSKPQHHGYIGFSTNINTLHFRIIGSRPSVL